MIDIDRSIRIYELRIALDGWRAPAPGMIVVRHEVAQGIVYALLRNADPVATTAHHDAPTRKALSVGPVRVQPLPGGLASATLRVASWSPPVTGLLAAAVEQASELRADLGGVPALLLDAAPVGAWSTADFLATPPLPIARVRFETPTFFGFGQYQDGTHRAHALPDPGLVVAAWLRAWRLTGDATLDWLPTRPEDLSAVVGLSEVSGLRTVVVRERTAALTGFVGECAFAWHGAAPAGRAALTTLARFAGICGTGAKTGRGFGQTTPLRPALMPNPSEAPTVVGEVDQ